MTLPLLRGSPTRMHRAHTRLDNPARGDGDKMEMEMGKYVWSVYSLDQTCRGVIISS